MSPRVKKILLYLLILTPLWSFLFWYFQPKTTMNVLIIDKTVSTENRSEHRSFNWILTYNKYAKPDGDLYDIDEDYMGFFPKDNKLFSIKDLRNLSEIEVDSIADTLDMLYFTDSYGVYYNEWYLDTLEGEHSKKIYGGMTDNDYKLLKGLKLKNKLIITEFNLFGHPTPRSIRNKTEDLFNIKWSGWTGRYFHLLDTLKNPELPKWVVRLYRKQNNGEWNFTKSGIVLVHESEKIVILENETNLNVENPLILTSTFGQEYYNLPEEIHYPFWFDITFSTDSMHQIVSKYSIETNEVGDSILNANYIPKEFPATIKYKGDYTFFYFSGDFADNPVVNNSAYMKGIRWIDGFLYRKGNHDREEFFWEYYIPLVDKILKDYNDK